MLKLYYDVNKYVTVGYIPNSLYIKNIIGNRGYFTNALTLTELTCKPGDDLTEFMGLDNSESYDRMIYIDAECTKPVSGLVCHIWEDAASYKHLRFVLSNNSGTASAYNWMQEFRVYDDWNNEGHLACFMSMFSSPDDLGSNEAEWRYFINKMFEFEKDIANGDGPENVVNLGYSPMYAPFIPANVLGTFISFTQWEMYPNVRGRMIPFYSAATMATLFLGYNAIQCSQMKLGDGTTFYPGVSYNPNHWNSNKFSSGKKNNKGYERDYEYSGAVSDTSGDLKYQSNNDAVVNNISTDVVDNVVSGGITITQAVSYQPVFIQLPSQFYTDTTTNYNTVFKMSNYRNLKWVGWDDFTHYMQDSTGSPYRHVFTLIQLSDINSIKNLALKYPNSADIFKIALTGDASPAFLAFGTCGTTSVRYDMDDSLFHVQLATATADENMLTNNMTGDEIIERFFNSDESIEDPDIATDNASDTIPEDTGGGGTTSSEKEGGDGTWDSSSDDTSINSSGDISDDNIAPAPTGVLGGLSGNFFMVKMNSAQLNKLADLMWGQGLEEGFWAYLFKQFGESSIIHAIAGIKYGNIEIPTLGSATVTGIAGYLLDDPIGCEKINQYNRYSFGTIEVPKYFGSFLDYSPFTEISLTLPYAPGSLNIAPELCVGKKVEVILTLDALTGMGVYVVQNSDGTQIAEMQVNVLADMPYSTSEYAENLLTGAQNVASTSVNAMQSYKPATEATTRTQTTTSEYFNAAGMSEGTVANTAVSEIPGMTASGGLSVGGAVLAGVDIVKNMANAAQTRAATFNAGSANMIGSNVVAIMRISRPYITYPTKYAEYEGLPSDKIGKISACTGYFEIEKLNPAFACPDDIMNEIKRILISGVYPK